MMPKYKNKGQKKPYNVAQSRVHNVMDKILTLDANKGAPLQTPQIAEAFKCSQCNDIVIMDYYNVSAARYCSKLFGISKEALAIIGELDSLHWYCQPRDVDVSKVINIGLPSNTMQDA